MPNKTNIEWCCNQDGSQGFTSNPVRGECPVGCFYCYVNPFRQRYGWHKDIRFYPEELKAIRRRKKPSCIFVGSTIELFHDKTIQYMPEIIETIKAYPQHRFYLLTKQPQNLSKFSPFPENCWVGVTATNNKMVFDGLYPLMQIKARNKYVSFEPLLGRLCEMMLGCLGSMLRTIDWVIIGAMTGTRKDLLGFKINHPDLTLISYGKKWTLQPKVEWVKEIVEACDKTGIPVFLKNNLKPLIFADPLFAEGFVNWAGELRQEMPE